MAETAWFYQPSPYPALPVCRENVSSGSWTWCSGDSSLFSQHAHLNDEPCSESLSLPWFHVASKIFLIYIKSFMYSIFIFISYIGLFSLKFKSPTRILDTRREKERTIFICFRLFVLVTELQSIYYAWCQGINTIYTITWNENFFFYNYALLNLMYVLKIIMFIINNYSIYLNFSLSLSITNINIF